MFDRKKIKDLILTSLVADSYCLGSHWVYDEKQLTQAQIDWNILNAPLAVWHRGKIAGEFTHYGDQTYWLYEFLGNKDSFNKDEFLQYWKNKVNLYEGYIDGATKNTLENIEQGITPSGSSSSDLSIVGRITPLLLVSNTKEEFLSNVRDLVSLTHNSPKALNSSVFFAKLLWNVLDGNGIEESILALKEDCDTQIQGYIQQAINSKDKDTFEAIREFGPACDVEGGFAGAIYLLLKHNNFKQMLVENAQAGGDSSARAMITSVIFMANKPMIQIPKEWLAIKATIK